MKQDDAFRYLQSKIDVPRINVLIAKRFIVENVKNEMALSELFDKFATDKGLQMPSEIVIHPSVDPHASLDQAAQYISWWVATNEATWELIHSGFLHQASESLQKKTLNLKWTTVFQGSGQSSGWNFPEYSIPMPISVSPSLSFQNERYPLANHDLYIHELNIENLPIEIENALREAIKCFRFELYTASLAMLGKANEGVWLSLGEALVGYASNMSDSFVEKTRKKLDDPNFGIGKKINDIVSLYERQDIFGKVSLSSRVSLDSIREIASWSHLVRESRNTIHYGVDTPSSNNYEKMAVILLGVIPNYQAIFRIINQTKFSN